MIIRQYEQSDLSRMTEIWNASVREEEVVYFPLSPDYWHTKFEMNPDFDAQYVLVAEEDGTVIGFIVGMAKKIFLDQENNENTPGYITCLFVEKAFRGNGIGKALVNDLFTRFRTNGKSRVSCSDDGTINLDWRIPGTPGHDHNNAPGVDVDCPGYGFFRKLGFEEQFREIAMYLNLADYVPYEGMEEKQAQLLAEGVYTGRYDASLGYDYDRMCDHVGSNYWREVIRSELACWKEHRPNTDPRFLPNGTKVPTGPRPMLVATADKHIVAFTGPVDMQESGRGWFCGIFTDPEYERRGIASILFHSLMKEFIAEGATFSTLFTGETNHAQRIYLRAGFRVVRRFANMSRDI